ncbi:CD109 antigen [Onthophagus taurus]|uniref:CD109 antigen n=1 Tax=Onthophagus taurus TaxID=166361 RepID=UPI0039BDD08E
MLKISLQPLILVPFLTLFTLTSTQLQPTSRPLNPFNDHPTDRSYPPQEDNYYHPGSRNDADDNRDIRFRDYHYDRKFIDDPIFNEATYFVVASKMVRPGQLYRVSVVLLKQKQPITVRASIQRNGVEVNANHVDAQVGIPETLLLQVPFTSAQGRYKLRVEGLYDNVLGGTAFVNETNLVFSQRSLTIFIQMDKPIYKQSETIRFRAIPINTELKPFANVIDVYMIDPRDLIIKRWLSRQSNLGTVSLSYQLSDQPVFGEWKIRVVARGQVEESTFLVEEYYQTRFEVNVTMPAFFFSTDEYIYGTVMANYTSGAPVRGNLTLKASIRPIRPMKRIEDQRDQNQNSFSTQFDPFNYNGFQGEQRGKDPNEKEMFLEFDESYPFWFQIPETFYHAVPSLKFFYGVYKFKYPMKDLLRYVSTLDDTEIRITATVGDRYLDEIIEGYSTARIFESSIKLSFLGESPQVFKPGMPATVYIVASFHDGSRIAEERLRLSELTVYTSIDIRNGGSEQLPAKKLLMSSDDGVWVYNIDLKQELQVTGPDAQLILSSVEKIRVRAVFQDIQGGRIEQNLLMLAHYSPQNKHLKVMTSTVEPKVGEYIIFHVRSNFYIDKYSYLVISKGTILITGDEVMQDFVNTIAITLSAEMAPVATVVVWYVGRYGDVVADSLTFPVNGISRNKFQVFINNKKARTGHKVEVAIFGEPGAYVGLSGIDNAFYTMQAGNELSYAKVISKMSTFDEQTNGTHKYTWLSHQGNPDEIINFPSSTFGIDANRTFEYIGLVVFSDVPITKRPSLCNPHDGYLECLDGECYSIQQKCDGYIDCKDGTDEVGCQEINATDLTLFRQHRFNKVQRLYDNVWLWRDVNIGPHGRYIFNIDVPPVPVHWMVSAFSMSPTMGYGMLRNAIEYVGDLPFYINVEMPKACKQGEQVGIRVTVFNYMQNNIEATVVLVRSPDYKFVHVEEDGVVVSYNPRTTDGEHQFFIYILAQDATVVYLPIVPRRLGDIDVTVYASTLLGRDQITRTLHVEADGLPQYRHQSMLLDLSTRGYAFQYMHVNITEIPIIPYEYDRYYVFGSNKAKVSIVGDVVGPVFPTMPINASSLLGLPQESAEQNIFSFAATMYTTLYMRYTIQRNKTLEREAFNQMNIAYQKQLSYLQPDGSFSLFRSDWNQSASSVWLTSYVIRLLKEATFYEWENFIYIDPRIIEKSVRWVLKHQTPEGSFYETTWSPDRKYNDSLNYPDETRYRNRNISLTAHVLIMLESVKDLSTDISKDVANAHSAASQWLERNMKLLREHGKPFERAIVAYALMKSRQPQAEDAFSILVQSVVNGNGYAYCGRERLPDPPTKTENQRPFSLPRLPYTYDSENIEATSYALLVYVQRREILVDAMVNWLNSQRLTNGGWASTSDTANAMKALIEYTAAERIRDVSGLTVTVEATALPGQSKVLNVNDKNRVKLQYVDIPEAWGTVKVQAKGTGYAILQMHVQYNVDVARFQTQPPVKAFDLFTRADFYGRNHSHINYVSCQRWTNLNESERSGMAVLDITIPTGYIIQQQRLDYYIRTRRVRNLQRAKFLDTKVLFYFDYLDNEETCVNLTVERWYPVANMSKYLPIKVYDYYAPERFNETIFDASSTYQLTICQVCGSSQCPYCHIYNVAFTTPIPFVLILVTSFTLIVRYFKLEEGVVI